MALNDVTRILSRPTTSVRRRRRRTVAAFQLYSQMSRAILADIWDCQMSERPADKATDKADEKVDVWQGTLALMVLKTLEVMGPLHGFGLARRIEQTSGHRLVLNPG